MPELDINPRPNSESSSLAQPLGEYRVGQVAHRHRILGTLMTQTLLGFRETQTLQQSLTFPELGIVWIIVSTRSFSRL